MFVHYNIIFSASHSRSRIYIVCVLGMILFSAFHLGLARFMCEKQLHLYEFQRKQCKMTIQQTI